MRVLPHGGEIFGTCSISFECLSGPKEGRDSYELAETKVSLQDTQFLRIVTGRKRGV